MARTLIPTRVPRTLGLFRHEMDDLFENFFGTARADQPVSEFSPRTNLAETDSTFELTVEVPGMDPKDFDVELNGNELHISGELKNESEEKEKTYHRIERSYGKFRRVFTLSTDVDADKIEAEYNSGILKITVGKAEVAKPKRIEVTS